MSDLELKELKNAMCAFLCTWGMQLLCGITVRNPLTILFFAAFFIIGRKVRNGKKKGITAAFIAAALLSVAVTLCFGKNAVAGFDSSLFRLIGMGLMIVGLTASYFRVLQLVFGLGDPGFKGNAVKKNSEVSGAGLAFFDRLSAIGDAQVLILSAVICFLCWLPYFLYEYPGIMTADSIVQYEQVIGVNGWSNHHPVVHTLVIALFYKLGYALTGDVNKAVSCYTIAQMIFLSLCCGRVILQVKRLLKNSAVAALSLAFYALVPFNAVFAVTMWKDIPFAGIMMLMGCRLVSMAVKENIGVRDVILLSVEEILISLFRSNGWYGFLLCAPFIIYIFKRDAAKVIPAILTAIVVVVIVKGPVMSAAGVIQPDFTESLSLPLQQVARVLVNDREISDKDRDIIEDVIDTTYIHELYAPDFADNIKELVRAGHPEVLENNKMTYLGLWLRLGLKYPVDYIRAWFDLEGGYVYSDIPYEVGNIDGIMPNDYGLIPTPLIGGKVVIKAKEIFIKLGSFVPLYGMLWCAGAYTWLVVYALWLMLKKGIGGRYRRVLPFVLLQTAIFLTLLIAAPVVDFRYEYGIVMLMPLTATICVIINVNSDRG